MRGCGDSSGTGWAVSGAEVFGARAVGQRLVRWLAELACDLGVCVEVSHVKAVSGRRVKVVLGVVTAPGEAEDVARSIRAATGAR